MQVNKRPALSDQVQSDSITARAEGQRAMRFRNRTDAGRKPVAALLHDTALPS
jgi:hypothetical protein